MILKATRGLSGIVNLVDILASSSLENTDVYVVLELAPADLRKLIK